MNDKDKNITLILPHDAENMLQEVIEAIREKRRESLSSLAASNFLNDKLQWQRFERELSRFERALLLSTYDIEDNLKSLK